MDFSFSLFMYVCMHVCTHVYMYWQWGERDLRGGEGQKERDRKNLMQARHSAQD